jgi:hypothetical protein
MFIISIIFGYHKNFNSNKLFQKIKNRLKTDGLLKYVKIKIYTAAENLSATFSQLTTFQNASKYAGRLF